MGLRWVRTSLYPQLQVFQGGSLKIGFLVGFLMNWGDGRKKVDLVKPEVCQSGLLCDSKSWYGVA